MERVEAWCGRRGARLTLWNGRVIRVQLLTGSPRRSRRPPRGPAREVWEYLRGRRRRFRTRPLLQGPPFHLRVWRALLRVPYGHTVTYAQLARLAGAPRAARAVGQAMRKNPVPLLVPCHRVVAASGALGGFSCGLEWKRFLLALEGIRAESALPRTGGRGRGHS